MLINIFVDNNNPTDSSKRKVKRISNDPNTPKKKLKRKYIPGQVFERTKNYFIYQFWCVNHF